MKKSWHLDRRTFLRGTGIAVALPMMEGMVPVTRAARAAASAKQPMRMLCVGLHLGMYGPAFFPKQSGAQYKAPELLQPIEKHRKDFTVFSGLDHAGVGKGHPATVNFLTGVTDPKKRKQMSLDQVAAQAIGSQTRFASLQLQAGSSKSQKGRNLSWAKGGVPLPLEYDPRQVFDRLFSNKGNPVKQKETRTDEQSVLDHVLEDARDLRRNLGKIDQGKLDEYLAAIREVEREIKKANKFDGQSTVPKTADLKIPDRPMRDVASSSKVMYQLISLAFAADLTRVVTVRCPGENHPASHHGKQPGKLGQLVGLQKRYVGELARLLDQLKSTSDANGPLLDHTMVLYGSGMGNTATHSTRNLPILLAGGGFKHGRHLDFSGKRKQPLSNLYVTMLQRMGVETNKFSNSRGSMNDLLT